VLEGCEGEILVELEKAVRNFDPDFILIPNSKFAVNYVSERAKANGLKLSLSRGLAVEGRWVDFNGRVVLDLRCFEEFGLAGIAELCNYSMLPPELAVGWPVGRLVDSRQCYEAIRRNVLLPVARSPSTAFRSLSEFHMADKGGLTFNPKVGVYENVCQLDFDSQYPNIIVKHNISYETVIDVGSVLREPRGFLAEITEYWLNRRLHFKRLAKTLPEGNLKIYAYQRQKALKAVLVVVYGYSGCSWNRFANVKCFEEINRISRKILIDALNVAEEEGFEVIYADVDSIYVHKAGAKLEDYEELRNLIVDETGLPMSIENWFKFIAFLPQQTNSGLSATKRYFGKLMSGELCFKGIEARRYDYPEYVKEVQLRMMETLFDAEDLSEVASNVDRVLGVLAKAVKALIEKRVPVEKLVVYKALHKDPREYSSMFPHVSAALQLMQHGYEVEVGDLIGYIHVRSRSKNQLTRVQAAQLVTGYYDAEKYIEMLVEAAETILSPLKIDKAQVRATLVGLR